MIGGPGRFIGAGTTIGLSSLRLRNWVLATRSSAVLFTAGFGKWATASRVYLPTDNTKRHESSRPLRSQSIWKNLKNSGAGRRSNGEPNFLTLRKKSFQTLLLRLNETCSGYSGTLDDMRRQTAKQTSLSQSNMSPLALAFHFSTSVNFG